MLLYELIIAIKQAHEYHDYHGWIPQENQKLISNDHIPMQSRIYTIELYAREKNYELVK